MNYKDTSDWNNINELRCLLILKKLTDENFPRNRQMQLCREVANISNLTSGSISAKVSNYKSLAGINNKSNVSNNSKIIYKKYKQYSISELEKVIVELSK
jgi:hypothetical protein